MVIMMHTHPRYTAVCSATCKRLRALGAHEADLVAAARDIRETPIETASPRHNRNMNRAQYLG